MKLILLLLLIDQILKLYIKPKYNKLYCGLFGWVGDNMESYNRELVHMKLSYLGQYNMTRGKDSSGLYYDMKVLKALLPFDKFAENGKVSSFVVENNPVILGHARKASVGDVTIKNTQPLMSLTNKDSFKFVITHNGTILNYKELASSYKLNFKIKDEYSDSRILGELLYEKGWDILKDYIGTAAFVYIEAPNLDTVYMFKGKSPTYLNGNYENEERPLYIMKEDGGFYYSSIESSLKAVRLREDTEIVDLPQNIIFKISKGNIQEEYTVDRSKSGQKEPIYNNTRSFPTLHNDYNSYYKNCVYGYSRDNNYESFSELPKETCECIDKIYFSKGRYYINGYLTEGIFHVDEYGNTYTRAIKEFHTKPYAFIQGVLLKKSSIYQAAFEKLKEGVDEQTLQHTLLVNDWVEYPFDRMDTKYGDTKHSSNNIVKYFSGEITPIFHNKTYKIDYGSIKNITTNTNFKWPIHYECIEDLNLNESVDTDSEDVCPICKGLGETFYPDINTLNVCDACNGTGSIKKSNNTDEDSPFNENVNSLSTVDNFDDWILVYSLQRILTDLDANIQQAKSDLIEFMPDEYVIAVNNKLNEMQEYISNCQTELQDAEDTINYNH